MADNPLLTTEDRAALAALPNRIRSQQGEMNGKLRPWMQLFAYIYALAPKSTMKIMDQVRQASELAGEPISIHKLSRLKVRPDFRELVDKFQAGGVEAALAKLKVDLPFYVETHRKGLEMAVEAKDYSVIPKYTIHTLEIVSPRRNDLMQQNLQVNITLSPKQLALEDAEPTEIVAEPIAPDTV